MNVSVIIVFLSATTFSLVETGCHNFKSRTDYEAMCWKWWEKARSYSSVHSSRRGCLNLIKDKCPHMIDTETKTKRRFDEPCRCFEVWSKEVKVSLKEYLKAESHKWIIYFEETYKTLCSDDGGSSPDCEYWWRVAKDARMENSDKELCINRILKHCKDTITQTGETSVCTVKRCRKGYDVRTVTYQKEIGDTASFNRYVPLKT